MYIDLIIYYDQKGLFMLFNNKYYKLSFIFFVFNILIIMCLFKAGLINVSAENTASPYVAPVDEPAADQKDLDNAIATAPKGLDISDPTFLRGQFHKKDSTEDMNASKVIRKSENNPNDKTGILRVTHNINQIGAIWSNTSQSNFLDVSQDSSMSMWLYFGKPTELTVDNIVLTDKEKQNMVGMSPEEQLEFKKKLVEERTEEHKKEIGDGMAFVLQNAQPDSSPLNPFGGIEAISRYDGNPAPGQTLGVWGADFNNVGTTAQNAPISQTAIPNSFAIEFDTFLNRLTRADDIDGKGVSFDADIVKGRNPNKPDGWDYYQNITGQHISMDYPDGYANYTIDKYDSNATYMRDITNGPNGFKTFFKMNHKNLHDNLSLTDANWHHMTVKFNHATSTLSYAFNDKNIDGTANSTSIVGSQQLDMSHFKLGDNKKLMWGFTGTTGRFTENNLIVFESIPSFVNADSKVSLEDTTKGTIIPDSGDDKVNIGDGLDFIYDLNYKNGSKEWSQILASMTLPSEVTFTDGQIVYDNDPDHPEEIKAREFNNGKVEHLMQKNLSNSNNHAKVVLHTTVNNRTSPVTVSPQHARFISDNFIVDDDTPEFNITIPSMLLTISDKIDYQGMESVPDNTQISGDIKYSNGSYINPSTITMHPGVNGVTQDTFNLSGSTSQSAHYIFNVPKSKLHVGSNTVTIKATDTSGNTSSVGTVIISIGGGLQYKVSDNVSFQSVNVGYAGQIVPRQNDWHIQITDGRDIGSSWTLQARAHDLINTVTAQKLDGEMVYKNDAGKILSLISPTDIYSNTKQSEADQTVNVENYWNSKKGIFLKLNNKNSSGNYVGKIDWVLTDGLPNK